MALVVTARKKATDPAQEKLRQKKQDWNKLVSEFVEELFETKNNLNGRFQGKRTRITDPVDSSVASKISQLSTKYNEIAHEALAIIEDQKRYSDSRKKTASLEDVNDSNALGRGWFYVKYPFMSDPNKIDRKSILQNCTKIDKFIVNLQDAVVSTGGKKEKLNSSYKNLFDELASLQKNMFNAIRSIERTKNTQEENNEKSKSQPDQAPKQESAPIKTDQMNEYLNILDSKLPDSIQKIQEDLFFSPALLNKDKFIKEFAKLKLKYKKKDNLNKEQTLEEIKALWGSAIGEAKVKYRDVSGNWSTLEELEDLVRSSKANDLDKRAGNFLSRQLKRKKLELSPLSDSTASARVRIYDLLESLKKTIDSMMNSVQDKFDPQTLISLFEKVPDLVEDIRKNYSMLSSNG